MKLLIFDVMVLPTVGSKRSGQATLVIFLLGTQNIGAADTREYLYIIDFLY